MSDRMLNDVMAHPGDLDSYTQLANDLDNIDIPTNLSTVNSELMSSDFFDSLHFLEEETGNFGYGANSDNISSSNIDSDGGLISDPEESRLNYNCSSDSASSNTTYELPDLVLMNNNNDQIDENSRVTLVKKPQEPTLQLNGSSSKVPGKLILNNPRGKKVILTKPYSRNNRKNISNSKHIYKVQSISGKGRTVFLPFHVSEVKHVKIINGNELFAENIQLEKPTSTQLRYEDSCSVSSPDSIDDDSDSFDAKSSRSYPALVLNEEEKRLLIKEGIRLPTHYPLSKDEEKDLKRIRRKIRNKLSAQDSRKRKKEYVDGLEARVKQNAAERKMLLNKVKALQQQNSVLVSQMQKLQSLVFNTNKATPTTCLLIVLMSALLISLPNLSISKRGSVQDEQQTIARRTLLSSQRATNEDNGSLDEFLLFDAGHRAKITTIDEEHVKEEIDAYLQNDSQPSQKKPYFQTNDIELDVRNTFDKLKDFIENQLGRISGGHEVSNKRARVDTNLFDEYGLSKSPRLNEEDCTDEYVEYISDGGSPWQQRD